MTRNGCTEGQVSATNARPAAPSPVKISAVHKRFTVRDGFHLKTRNAEAQAAIDAQLTTREETPASIVSLEVNVDNFNGNGPTIHEIDVGFLSPQRKPRDDILKNNNMEARLLVATKSEASGDETQCATITAVAVHDRLLQSENIRLNSRGPSSGKVRAALKTPTEWLIYRHRPSEIQQRKQQKVNKLLNDMLHNQELQNVTSVKQSERRRLRCQSTLGSTYSQRVAAARPVNELPRKTNHRYDKELLQPLTETERGLLRSREVNNKAVDKLLVSLFHPLSSSPAAVAPFAPSTKPSTFSNRFSTRRSLIRHKTAVALRSHKLVSRMNEFRSFPQILEQMEAIQLCKKQQHIEEHGVDIVARNRANPTLHVLQKPLKTPLLPSATDHKVHQANRRKQELDAAKEENVRRIVVRWQTRREQRTEHARRVHLQTQWLLVVALAESSKKWLTKFHEFRTKRSALVRVSMAKRLQRYWRQRGLVKHNPQQLLSFGPNMPLSSAFFHMPVVIHAVTKVQEKVRDWLKQKHQQQRKTEIALIITAWFDFQDVKFRRIILRFRKRVRDFQVMWRAWRAITAARIKLLLLVWAKLERKVKRRHGVTLAPHSISFALIDNPPQLQVNEENKPSTLSTGKGLTVLNMLQQTTVERPMSQHHKQLEDIHRHFRNGGAVHTPISYPSTSTNSLVFSFQPSPPSPSSRMSSIRPRPADNLQLRQDRQLRDDMKEEFQFVMYDVYNAQQNFSSKMKSTLVPTQIYDGKRSLGKPRTPSSRGSQASPSLQLPSGVINLPVPPSSKKIPHQLKVTMLRKLLSEKRKIYSDARDCERESWTAARKKMRAEVFRYDVLDELTAFQQLQAKYATFLLLHSITEAEMVRLIHQTQEELNVAEAVARRNSSQTHRKSISWRP